MFWKLLLIAVVIVGIGFFIMSIKVMFHRTKKFPSSSVGKNKEMVKRGITCAKHDEIKCFKAGAEQKSCC